MLSALLIISGLTFFSCTKSNPDGDKKVYHAGNGAEPASIDPHIATGVPEHHIMVALFEGLSSPEPKTLAPSPGAAERWDISDDLKTYTFYLRKDGKWSDGTPVTAQDFVFSWMRSLAPGLSEYAYMLYPVKNAEEFNLGKLKDFSKVGIQAKDDHTLVVTLKAATPYFLTLLHHYSTWPVPKATIEKYGDWNDRNNTWTQPGKIVSNGPFKLKAHELNKKLVVERNPNYWNASIVKLDEIHFYPTTDLSSEEREFRTGKLHFTYEIPAHKVQKLVEENPEETRITPYLGTYFYRFNVTKKPMNDVRVRKALALTVDRESLVKNVTRANQVPAYSFVPPDTAGYTSENRLDGNIDDAKKLLAEAGYPEGKGFPKVDILFNTHDLHKDVAVAIQQMWKKNLGIDVGLNNQEWKVYLDTEKKLNYNVSRAGWIGDYNDPNTFLDMFTSYSGNNRTGWKNKEYDALIGKASITGDQKERYSILQQAEKMLIDNMIVLPLYTYTVKHMVSKKLTGYHDNILDTHMYQYMDLKE